MATHENNQSNQQGSGAGQRNTIRRDNADQDGAMQQEFSGMNQSQYAPDGEKKSAGAEQGQAGSPNQQSGNANQQAGNANQQAGNRSQQGNNANQQSGAGNQQTANQQQQGSGNTVKDPDDWTTGEQPMTGAQNSYLHTLASEAGEQVDDNLTKAEASKKIDELQQKTGRGLS